MKAIEPNPTVTISGKIWTLAVLAVLVIATSAKSQTTDLMGIFFDEQGTQTSLTTSTPNEIVPIYLILLNPSHSEGISSWECTVETVYNEVMPVVVWELAGDGANLLQPPQFSVYLLSPLPPGDAVVLATANVIVADPSTEILFYLHCLDPPSLQDPPGWGYPVTTPIYGYGNGGLQSLGWTSGCEAEPVARINDDGEDPVWGLGDLPEDIVFRAAPIGESVTRYVTIDNTGEVALSGQLDISGDGFRYCYHYYYPHYYSGIWTTDLQWFRIEPGQRQGVEVRLESATDERYEGALDLTLCGETTTIVLVKQPAFYSCTIEPDTLDLGEIDLYALDPWEGPVAVTNDGTLPLELVADEDCPDFVVGSCELILPGRSCDLWVTFDPSELGPQECVVSINDGLCELVCTAVVVEGPPQCVISPPDWDFGLVWAGEPVQQTFEVLNAGGPQLEGQATIPESCSGFTLTDGAEPFSLAHDESHHFTVAFDPVAWGHQECNISVSADCSDVALLGLGMVPDGGCWYYEYGDPPIFGSVDTPGSAGGVAVSNSFAYVADGESGLQVIDITNSASPYVTGSVSTSSYAGRVAISGSYAYVATDNGLAVIDVNDPFNPQFVVEINTGYASDVAVVGDYAYVTGGSFKVIDISDPRNPWIAAVADTTVVYATSQLAISSGYAYVTVGIYPGSFMVLDITNPMDPQFANLLPYSSSSESSCHQVTVSGDYLFVTGSTMVNVGGIRPIWYSTYLRRFDISTPGNPVSAGGLTRQTGSGSSPGQYGGGSVAIAGNIAYVTSGGYYPSEYKMEILNGLYRIGEVEGWSSAELVIGGEFIYSVGGNSGMQVLLQQCDNEAIVVDIDVKPGSDTNPINCGPQSNGVIPVAVLTINEFDASSVDHETVRFGPEEAAEAHSNPHGPIRHEEDVDGDGDLDLVFHFRKADTGIECGDTKATLTGETYDGQPIIGTDAIQTVWGDDKIPVAGKGIRITPNPFNPQTTVSFSTDRPQHVRVAVYDIRGRLVAKLTNQPYPAGAHSIDWLGRDAMGRAAPSGEYFFRVDIGGRVETRKAMLVR